ncbi:Phosphotransferase enzyme family protein [Glycomyces harbinensis]|uniref:Phosphotransferase enzyme family protein n=1 Tax=Glycomyces harbinensis TaxID=58114 RepID=A0A1G7C0V7_9ACTN|nr:Phosphotransferase enzyme family protein [Glycomyces harbinensis]
MLKADEPYPVWKLTTDSGTWVVKVDKPWGDYVHGLADQSGQLEAAAWRAGVSMAEPHLVDPDSDLVWRPIGDDLLARATRFVEGAHPALPADPSLARWAGGTIAALERLAIPADLKGDFDFTVHSMTDWDEWLDQGVDLGVIDGPAARTLKDCAERTYELLDAVIAAPPVKLTMHRDFSSDNIMVTAEGPVLLDFDSAGPQAPWWELVSVAFSLAGPALGVVPPERASVEACVEGYLAAGGRLGPTDESAFVGTLAGRLSSTAYELWRACGHRGGSAELQAQFGGLLRASIPALHHQLDATAEWASWLRGRPSGLPRRGPVPPQHHQLKRRDRQAGGQRDASLDHRPVPAVIGRISRRALGLDIEPHVFDCLRHRVGTLDALALQLHVLLGDRAVGAGELADQRAVLLAGVPGGGSERPDRALLQRAAAVHALGDQ